MIENPPLTRASLNKNDMRYHVTRIGEKYAYACKKNSPNEYGMIFCDDIVEFKINVNSLRYMKIYAVGYYGPDAGNTSNTPYIEIGTCSPL